MHINKHAVVCYLAYLDARRKLCKQVNKSIYLFILFKNSLKPVASFYLNLQLASGIFFATTLYLLIGKLK